MTELAAGTEIAGYRAEALLGRGGMGVVYRALDLALERPVALKVLSPELAADERFRERFLRESRLAASLDHPSIVPVFDAGEAHGQLYMAMRLVEGTDLRALLRTEGKLQPARALAIVGQVADALDAAHERGLVHRDVKPSNVLIDARGHAYLADFGLSRRLGEAAAGLGAAQSLGTVDYVSPEQIRADDLDGRADLYSLGCLLHECLTGEPPFGRSSDVATLFAHLEAEPPAPAGLEAVFAKALAKAPVDRYRTGRELVAAACAGLGLEPRGDRRVLALAAVGLALIGAALFTVLLTRGGSTPAAGGGRLLRIDPATNRVGSTIPVGDGPVAVAAGSGRVWVASYRDGALWEVDPEAGAATKIAAVGRPFAIAIREGRAYVAADGPGVLSGNIAVFDAATGGRVVGRALLACSLAAGSYGIWVAGCPNVEELFDEGVSTLRLGKPVVIPYAQPLTAADYRDALVGLAEGEGAVWAIGDAADRRLWRIDPRRRRIVATISLGFPPAAVAAGAGAVWVTDELGDRLVRIDPAKNRIVRSIAVGRGAAGVAVGAGGVWVADAIGHSVTRVDPATNRVVATIHVAARPQAVAVGDGRVWAVGDAR